MTFGEKLQALRNHHDFTQESLAEKLNISRATISRWEQGKALPDIQQVMILSELFQVTVDYLMYENDKNDETAHFRDFRSLRLVFWVCTVINGVGMVIAMLGWREIHSPIPVVLGLVMNLLACVFLEVFPPKGIDRTMMQYARRRFYAANVWMLLPTPFYVTVELICSVEHYHTILPYLIAGAAYILLAAGITIRLMYLYRK